MSVHLINSTADVQIDDTGAPLKQGDSVLVWCQGCHVTFQYDVLNDSDTPPAYHARNCQRKIRERVKRGERKVCLNPGKIKYKTGDEAHAAHRAIQRSRGNAPLPYLCQCGSYHLGNGMYVVIGGNND